MEKLFKALDEVVAWFKKEETVVEADIHAALSALHIKHVAESGTSLSSSAGPALDPLVPVVTEETLEEKK